MTEEARDAVPAGDYYSAIPNLGDVARDAARLFRRPSALPGIELNEKAQLELLKEIARYYPDLPFGPQPRPGLRYYFENDWYSYSDAICLYGMMRHLKPRRIIEVGSGFSSAVMLDTDERFLNRTVQFTFIEPHPERLLALMTPEDRHRAAVVTQRLQDVDLGRFAALEANDILFVDSSHVLKIGSDVHMVITEILPQLRPGVAIHFHDVFYPFEYPREWIERGWYWTEAYALRAFLEFNAAFQIILFNTYLQHFHRAEFERGMPLCLENEGGSIWLRRAH